MMNSGNLAVIRRQLTMFVDPADSGIIEEIRRKFNPVQFRLIAAHVTLCREDELPGIIEIRAYLDHFRHQKIRVNFGRPERFDHGKGLLLPGLRDNNSFQNLRVSILQPFTDQPRVHHPHITLVHPRNATCTDEIFDFVKNCDLPVHLYFSRVSLIEQHDGGVWRTQYEWSLQE